MGQTPGPSIDSSAVREQLAKILNHDLFARSERMARFLRLAVGRVLDEKPEQLKEYLIGVEVFDRKPSYDPRVDPIVRVEARRLRSKLKAYYESDGRSDPILIEFPPGGYAPSIHTRHQEPARRNTGPITLAVLPFANLSASPEDEYFSDGITEELIHAITQVPGLRVVAWNTAVSLSRRERDMASLREELKVDTVLTGSVRIAGSSLRVRAQLIDTRDNVYLWSETFDRPIEDVFAIQEEISSAIVRTLQVRLAVDRQYAFAGRGRCNLGSYQWYLQGRYLLHRRSPEELKRSVQCFENAVAVDPGSALAHAGLADAYALLVDYGLMHPSISMPKAREAATRAIELEPRLAEAHTSLAFIRGLYDHEWEEAEALYRHAIALNPGYATAHFWLATDHYAMLGRFEEAAAEVAVALDLDPLSSIIYEGRAFLLLATRKYEEAIAEYRRILGFDPSFYKAWTSMGRAYAQLGRYREALEMLGKGRALAGDLPNIVSAMGQVYAASGDRANACAMLAQLEAYARQAYIPSTCFALVYLGLGDYSRALDFLETGCDQRETPMAVLKVHPVYDPLRGDPRFERLIERLRLSGSHQSREAGR